MLFDEETRYMTFKLIKRDYIKINYDIRRCPVSTLFVMRSVSVTADSTSLLTACHRWQHVTADSTARHCWQHVTADSTSPLTARHCWQHVTADSTSPLTAGRDSVLSALWQQPSRARSFATANTMSITEQESDYWRFSKFMAFTNFNAYKLKIK